MDWIRSNAGPVRGRAEPVLRPAAAQGDRKDVRIAGAGEAIGPFVRRDLRSSPFHRYRWTW